MLDRPTSPPRPPRAPSSRLRICHSTEVHANRTIGHMGADRHVISCWRTTRAHDGVQNNQARHAREVITGEGGGKHFRQECRKVGEDVPALLWAYGAQDRAGCPPVIGSRRQRRFHAALYMLYGESGMKHTGRCENDVNVYGYAYRASMSSLRRLARASATADRAVSASGPALTATANVEPESMAQGRVHRINSNYIVRQPQDHT